jgi:CTP synthase (UTP-ammonia lyase)
MNSSHSYGIQSVMSIGSKGQEHAKAIDSKVMKSCCAASNKYINSAEMAHVYKLPTDLVATGVARARPQSAQPFAFLSSEFENKY